jgi:hypothetical protein
MALILVLCKEYICYSFITEVTQNNNLNVRLSFIEACLELDKIKFLYFNKED